MKHELKITLFLLVSFIAAQFIGLLVMNHYIAVKQENGVFYVEYKEVPFVGTPPEVNQTFSFIPIIIAVLIGTAIIFLIMKFGKPAIFRYWVSMVVFLTLTISFFAFISQGATMPLFTGIVTPYGPIVLAIILSAIMTFFKFFRPNVIAHNVSEIFIYGGIATIFVPLLNLASVTILLILISVYDAIAVWKSKHMITLAKFQAESKAFSGLMIPYKKEEFSKKAIVEKKAKKTSKVAQVKTAILGGGDIAFPLMFAGVIMKNYGLAKAFIIPLCVTVALALLLFKGKEDRFYPAMPFLSAGCLIGLLIVLLI